MREYTQLWIISCLLFLMNILCTILIFTGVSLPGLTLALNLFGVSAVFTVFRASRVIDNIPYNKFWGLYILLLLVFGAVFDLLKVDPLIIASPFYLYQLFLIGAIVYTILRKWRFSAKIKVSFSLAVFISGFFEIYGSMAIIQGTFTLITLYLDMFSLLLLNFAFTLLYQISLKSKQKIREDYLFVLAEKAVDIIFYYTLHPYPRFAFISPSVENIIGYKQQDFYDNPKFYMELTHEKDREIIGKAFSVEAGLVNKNFIRWQRKDGEFIYLEFNNTPIFSGDKLIAIEGILRDITDRKMAEQEMIDSRKSKQILLSYISHELKTPITYIVGYAEALQKNLFQNEEERNNAIDLISSKAVFLQKLVEDLFQLSKMEANQFSFEFIQAKVYSLFSLLDRKYHNDVLNKKIQFATFIDDSLKDEKYEVLVDIKRIEQVFSNILHNAIKHTPENGTIIFTCTLDDKKEHAVFNIRDNGIGIPKEDLPYIFKKFYRGKSIGEKSSEGSGLGLSLSLQIVQAHKGDLKAQLNKDKGSTFSFTIPLYTEEASYL